MREAQLSQYNYILVVGEQEQREGTVNVRTRDNIVHGMHSIDGLIAVLRAEKDTRSLTSKFETAAGRLQKGGGCKGGEKMRPQGGEGPSHHDVQV